MAHGLKDVDACWKTHYVHLHLQVDQFTYRVLDVTWVTIGETAEHYEYLAPPIGWYGSEIVTSQLKCILQRRISLKFVELAHLGYVVRGRLEKVWEYPGSLLKHGHGRDLWQRVLFIELTDKARHFVLHDDGAVRSKVLLEATRWEVEYNGQVAYDGLSRDCRIENVNLIF